MKSRLDFLQVSPKAAKALLALQAVVNESGLEHSLLELVKMRASQINGCAYCIDMHSKDAIAAGETPQRLLLLDAWREAPFYSERERAALAWTEAVTRLRNGDVPDEVYESARAQFSEEQLVLLSLAVIAINSWNRMLIPFRTEAGNYRPGMFRNLKVA
jgi:AhpD family alkylhydroperoxidase